MPIFPDLENKIVLVTGATRGIGREIALVLAHQKAHVVFNYRSESEAVNSLKSEIEKIGARATAIKFDVNNTAAIKESIDLFTKEFGPISGLVNNAGISKDTLILRQKEEELIEILNTNLKSVIMLTSTLSRNFLKAPDVSVVNMSSVVGLMGNSGQSAYAASKAGIIGFTKSFAKEMSSKNVRCNAVCPGFIETDMTNTLDDKVKEAYLSSVPLKRFGTTTEVANLVCFLLSKSSGYITGEVIKIDGGLYI